MPAGPILFVNVGWMVRYAGPSPDDPTIGNHGWLKINKHGHEAWNFQPVGKDVFGYVPRSARINLRKLGSRTPKEAMTGVTVVWIARSRRNSATYIVGWYGNATVFPATDRVTKIRDGSEVEYQLVAPTKDAVLLPVARRLLKIPTAKAKGNLGQSPLWYGGNDAFRQRVIDYIAAGGNFPKSASSKKPKRQSDPVARKLIEVAAVKHATKFYESVAGGSRVVESVELDGVGWDLNVTAPTGELLKVEVKGLSGNTLVVELTPNEYAKMRSPEHRQDYIVYIVTEAGTQNARSHIFQFDSHLSKDGKLVWMTDDARELKMKPLIGARLYI